MKVYVITQGSYSDYHICAVSVDKERAVLLSRYFSDGDGLAQVEEYDTEAKLPNSEVLFRLIPIYKVEIRKDGRCFSGIIEYHDSATPYKSRFTFGTLSGDGDTFYAFLTANDEAHARKIAFDKRAQMVAERFGL